MLVFGSSVTVCFAEVVVFDDDVIVLLVGDVVFLVGDVVFFVGDVVFFVGDVVFFDGDVVFFDGNEETSIETLLLFFGAKFTSGSPPTSHLGLSVVLAVVFLPLLLAKRKMLSTSGHNYIKNILRSAGYAF